MAQDEVCCKNRLISESVCSNLIQLNDKLRFLAAASEDPELCDPGLAVCLREAAQLSDELRTQQAGTKTQ